MLVLSVAGFIGYKFYAKPAPQYFAQIHIGESAIASQVQAFIIFDRVPMLDSPAGLAHYTEHLVALSALAEDFKAADRHANAYTSASTVGYWVKGPKHDLPLMIENLGGVFEPISIDIEFANEEVDIVLREYDLRSGDDIDYSAYEAMTPFMYEGNGAGGWSFSTPESILSLDYEQAVAYYNATHDQSSAVLLVLGDVSKAQVQAAIEASSIKPLTGKAKQIKPTPFKLAASDTKHFTFRLLAAEPRIIYRKIVSLEKPVDYDFLQFQTSQLSAVLHTNLPGGIASPLRYDNFIARSFQISIEPLDEQHIEFWFVANPDRGISFKQLQTAFEDALKEASNGIPISTYERVQARSEQYWVDWEDEDATTEWMSNYTQSRVTHLRSPLPEKELKKLSKQVSLDDLNALLAALQQPGRQSVAYIGVNNGEDQ